MERYSIKKAGVDFNFYNYNPNTKGTRFKRLVFDNDDSRAWFKYQGSGYDVSESCSEKMCYEIAKVLGYKCAKIELAFDENNELEILNYLLIYLMSYWLKCIKNI